MWDLVRSREAIIAAVGVAVAVWLLRTDTGRTLLARGLVRAGLGPDRADASRGQWGPFGVLPLLPTGSGHYSRDPETRKRQQLEFVDSRGIVGDRWF